MEIEFNLTGLHPIFIEAVSRCDPILAFEVSVANGRFAFLIFFSEEDKKSEDTLYLLLRETQCLLKLLIYRNHYIGDFLIRFHDSEKYAIFKEMGLSPNGNTFNLCNVLQEINDQIPVSLPLRITIDTLRDILAESGSKFQSVLHEGEKKTLIGIKRLPNGKKPRDKTLRKLYLYTNSSADTIAELIADIKRNGKVTLAWTDNPNIAAKSLSEIMALMAT